MTLRSWTQIIRRIVVSTHSSDRNLLLLKHHWRCSINVLFAKHSRIFPILPTFLTLFCTTPLPTTLFKPKKCFLTVLYIFKHLCYCLLLLLFSKINFLPFPCWINPSRFCYLFCKALSDSPYSSEALIPSLCFPVW